jgi:hypothetical protein
METYEVTVENTGTIRWSQNGNHHRVDGPAVEYANGDKVWYQNGLIHRLDGPAIELSNGSKEWYIKGKKYTEEEFYKKINPVKELTVKQISELLGYEVKIIK